MRPVSVAPWQRLIFQRHCLNLGISRDYPAVVYGANTYHFDPFWLLTTFGADPDLWTPQNWQRWKWMWKPQWKASYILNQRSNSVPKRSASPSPPSRSSGAEGPRPLRCPQLCTSANRTSWEPGFSWENMGKAWDCWRKSIYIWGL